MDLFLTFTRFRLHFQPIYNTDQLIFVFHRCLPGAYHSFINKLALHKSNSGIANSVTLLTCTLQLCCTLWKTTERACFKTIFLVHHSKIPCQRKTKAYIPEVAQQGHRSERNASPLEYKSALHWLTRMKLSVACRDDSLYLTTQAMQGGLIYPRGLLFLPHIHHQPHAEQGSETKVRCGFRPWLT